jgi:long-subunit fatty acid transport protein
MSNERWDIELDLVYYFTSMYDYTQFTNSNAEIDLVTIDGNGTESGFTTAVGDCIDPPVLAPGELCRKRRVRTQINGKNQATARLGADYNVLPGLFTVRGGVSYETDGQDVEWLNVQQYMYGRTGLHTGFTVRIADKTDFSFGFAHFIQKDIKLQVSGRYADYIQLYRQASTPEAQAMGISPDTYHLQFGSGFAVDPTGPEAMAKGPFDGAAGVEVPNSGQVEPGPYFINAGSYYYNLSVLSVEVTQRF